jgi:hypothetical protein
VLLVSVGASLAGISKLSHGLVFSIIFALFIWRTYKIRPFNYHRANLWQLASMIGVSYISFLSVLSNIIGDKANLLWFIALMIGWGGIVLGAYLIQRKYLPNLLVAVGETKRKIGANPIENYSKV